MQHIPAWMIVIVALLGLSLLTALRGKTTGRSLLYLIAVRLEYGICIIAALLPTLATVIEELPERFHSAWKRERGDRRMEPVRVMKSAAS